MKKNAMLKIAAVVLVAVLLTTCAISTTFAKYVTPTVDKDYTEARVARWGITITNTSDDQLFANKYGSDASTIYVQGVGSDLVVAPGTTNENAAAVSLTIDGPEVAYKLTATADFELDTVANAWQVEGGSIYFPVKFTIGGSEVDLDGQNTLALKEAALEAAFLKALFGNGVTVVEDAGVSSVELNSTDVGYVAPTGGDVSVSWEWDFYTSDANDIKDTYLGNHNEANTINFNYTVGAEQIGVDPSVGAQ